MNGRVALTTESLVHAIMQLIPDELRQAHEDSKVVFFCGAGVSMPAGYPSFRGLVEAVLTDLLPMRDMCKRGSTAALAWLAFDNERYDEALDVLEKPGEGGFEQKDVRDRVCHHLTISKVKTLDTHVTLLDWQPWIPTVVA